MTFPQVMSASGTVEDLGVVVAVRILFKVASFASLASRERHSTGATGAVEFFVWSFT